MAWPRGDPATEIDGLISRHHDNRQAWQHLLDDANDAERRLLTALAAARDMQTRARIAIAFDLAEIADLDAERAGNPYTEADPIG